MAFSLFDNEEAKCCTPRVIVLDENNRIVARRGVAL
jgi:aspartate 1-decarboxylase